MGVTIVDEQDRYSFDRQYLAVAVNRVLELLEVADLIVEITIVDDVRISQFNAKYFGRDQPTNVISFPQDQEHGLLGDVVISTETVVRETAAQGYSVEEGLLYYAIHAILHLLKYEHVGVSKEVADEMYRKQEELFEQVLSFSL
ncbi:MAG: rRNA maturation RNase YbeY [Xanthomonadaceae bacterium]|nr:rRNA maturation RNase YbeY [Xanthomonadaceae bacterium]